MKPIYFFVFLLLLPIAVAEEEEECGLSDLASCIPEYLYNFFLDIINAPIQPLLFAIKGLLTADVSTSLFYDAWQAVTYVLSFFYLFLFLYVGFAFLTSGGNPIKRAHAKEALQNYVFMIILITGSYYIYALILTICSAISAAILDMINPTFFLFTFDNVVNIALQGIFLGSYLLALFFALFFLVIRYIVVSFGVVLFPLGLFCYFIPPLRGYGRFILNILGVFIFVVVIDLLIILVCSMIVESSVFDDIKIMVMIACFSLINYSLFWAITFAITKSSTDSIKDDVQSAIKYLVV